MLTPNSQVTLEVCKNSIKVQTTPRRYFWLVLALIALTTWAVVPLRKTSAAAASINTDNSTGATEMGGKYISALQRFNRSVSSFAVEPQPFTFGVCNTAGPIEVESSSGSLAGTPTAYATLQLAFAAINGGTLHLGVITIDVCGNTTETVPSVLNQVAGVTSITMSPAGGAARTISGAIAAGSPLVDLNGADNVTINGSNTGGNSLTISNTTIGTTAGSSTIRFIADASNNTVTNCTILGSTASTLATVAGTVVFATGTTTGNDNNTVSNCNIGPAGANLPSKAIMASGSSSAIENDNVIISGNNIFDFFLATGSHSAINLLTGNEAWSISNNKFYQTATRTVTTAASRHAVITLNNSTGGFTVSGNTIGFSAANGTGTYTITGTSNEFRAVDAASVRTSAPATTIQNNTVTAINQTSSRASTTTASSAFIAVAMGTTDGLINATGNTIGSLDGSSTIVINETSTTASTAPVIGFYNFSFFDTTVSNNNIGSITIASGGSGTTVGFRGILVNTTTGAAAAINNNTIANITDTQVGNYAMYGIQSVLPNLTATGNTVRNMTSASNGSSLIVSSGILASGSTGSNTISRNTIHSLFNASGAVANSIYGMSLSMPATTNVVERNFIHSLSLTTTLTGSQIWGISGGATGTTTYRNNMIRLGYDAGGTSITLPTSMIGIRDSSGSSNQYFHNTIFIGGTGVLNTPTPSNSYCFFSDVTAVTRAHQNNIYWNARSNAIGGGTAHIVTREGGTAANPAGLTSNFNILYFTGVDGATGVFNAVVVPTLAAWRTATGQDTTSIHSDPKLIAATGGAATVDLHIDPALATLAEGNGTLIASVTDDFDGQTRSGLTPVDIGADAGNFTGVDVTPPIIAYSALANTLSNANRTLTISVTDLSGVPTAGAGLPRIYFRKGAVDPYVNTQCTFTGGSSYDCLIDYALVTGGGAIAGDTIQYYVAAQDNLNNVSVSPSAGASGLTANPPAASTPPNTPNSYLISTAFTGSYTVDAGGAITSLTNAGGIFQQINSGVVTGDITINIASNLTGELGTFALNEFAPGFTVTIKPIGAARAISGTNASGLIKLAGADGVVIDGSLSGGTDRSLTITNSSSTGADIWLATNATSGANSNTVKNCILSGPGAFGGQGLMASSGVTVGDPAEFPNSNNTVQNNLINRVQNGVFINGNAATLDQNWLIADNTFGSSVTADKLSYRGVFFSSTQNAVITRNLISGISSSTSTSSTMSGIQFFGTVLGGSISHNVIKDIRQNNTVGWGSNGIFLSALSTGSGINIFNNFISDIASQGFNDVTSGDNGYGMMIDSGGGYNIYHNTVVLNANQVVAGGNTAAINVGANVTAAASVDLRNNILVSTQTVGTRYAVIDSSPQGAAVFSNINRNDYLAQNVGFLTSARATLANWQTATGADANSQSVDPLFVTATDFHLTAGSTLLSQAVSIVVVTNDIDGDARPATSPDIGADEVVQAEGGSFPGGTFYNAAGTTGDLLAGNVTVTNRLTLTGKLNAGVNTLTMNCGAMIVGASSSNYVLGNLKQMVCAPGAFSFPVGTANGYSPVDATVTANGGGGSDSLAVRAVQNYYGGASETPALNPNSLQRYWDLNKTGSLTANIKWTFLPGDVLGAGLPYSIIRISGTTAASFLNAADCGTNPVASPCVDVANNFMYMANVSTFSKWTGGPALAPTATGAGISGRVTTADGRGITNARVFLSGGGLTESMMVQTGQLGVYEFDGLVIGRTYVVMVQSQRFTFAESTRLFELNANVANADFVAEPAP